MPRNLKREEQLAEELNQMLNLLRNLTPHYMIARKFYKSSGSITHIAKKHGIYSPKAVRQLLKTPEGEKMSSEELAQKTGAYVKAIERLREELESERREEGTENISNNTYNEASQDVDSTMTNEILQRNVKDTLNNTSEEQRETLEDNVSAVNNRTSNRKIILSIEEEKKILDLARKGVVHSEIAELFGKKKNWITSFVKSHGIYSVRKIKQMIIREPETADAILAEKTGVYVETIGDIKRQIQREKRIAQKQERNQKATEKELTQPSASKIPTVKLEKHSEPVITYQYIEPKVRISNKEKEFAKQLGVTDYQLQQIKFRLNGFPAIQAIAKEFDLPRETVQRVQDSMQQEEYARRHTEVEYKMKMVDLRGAINRTGTSSIYHEILKNKVDVLLTEFSAFLTEEDYALLAYGYAKAKDYTKAIEVGETYLGLENSTLSDLQQKIDEVIQKGLEAKGQEKSFKGFEI